MTNKIEQEIEQAANEYASFHSTVLGKCVNLEKEYAFIAGANYALEKGGDEILDGVKVEGYHDVNEFYKDGDPATPQKQEAVEFLNWCYKNEYLSDDSGFTTSELYAKWKEGK